MANALKNAASAAEVDPPLLHQFLHGYANGHRLLECSINLPDDLSRSVLRLSDISGTNMAPGFEEYITGYPLTSINAYALAKTWYAPEMPRPGCVWTHTIVVPQVAMALIRSLGGLKKLFKRPGLDAPTGSYTKSFHWKEEHLFEASTPLPSDLMGVILSLHYQKDSTPIILAAKTSSEYENIVFSLWSQMWPHLRMNFTFCTGALSARTFDKHPFDVLCVPKARTREIVTDMKSVGSSDPVVANSGTHNIPAWALEASKDASKIEGGAFRRFLWSVSDEKSQRTDFVSYVRIFEALNERIGTVDLISLVAELFPEPRMGRFLKQFLFNGESNDVIAPSHEEQDILFALGTTNKYLGFNGVELNLRSRGGKLFEKHPNAGNWLITQLFQSNLNPLGEEIIAGLISCIEPETAYQVTKNQLRFLPALFRANPSLASASELWRAGGGRKRELFEAIASHKDLDAGLIKKITRAILDSESDYLVSRALVLWGKDAVFGVLDWLTAHNGPPPETCLSALQSHVVPVIEWIKNTEITSFRSLFALVRIVAPSVTSILHDDTAMWLSAFRNLKSAGDEKSLNYVSAFLLALALGNAQPSPLDLLSESFECVHEAARTESLSDSAWMIVEPFVPELSWISNWDKCERLRRGLVMAFVRFEWPPSKIRYVNMKNQLFQEIIRSANKVEGGGEFVRRVKMST
ncbi:MAG: hypothetical protein H8K09_07015 [Nitrospira sp.]|nr:hypothetical protein [Nitrospira sp.]